MSISAVCGVCGGYAEDIGLVRCVYVRRKRMFFEGALLG